MLRRTRDAAEVRRTLDEVKRAAAGQENVLYPLRSALAARSTVGEVCDALREVWGLYQPADVYVTGRNGMLKCGTAVQRVHQNRATSAARRRERYHA